MSATVAASGTSASVPSHTAKRAAAAAHFDEHPLLGRDYTVPTPDIVRLGEALRLWHRAGITGALLLGPTRIGKTSAVDDCIANIDQIVAAPCFATRINWRNSSQLTDRNFFARRLAGLDYRVTDRATADALERCLVERLATAAYNSAGRRCLLFIDDANTLTPKEYRWLCHIFNELHNRGVTLVVFLIGQPEMRGSRALLRDGGDTQVIGRFMRAEFVFQGVTGDTDLEGLLRWLDNASEHPPGSGQSYLQPFIPRALASGFRLDRLAGRLWSAYLEWRPQHKADEHAGMGRAMSMMTFNGAVSTLVQELAARDSENLEVEEELLGAVMRLVAGQHI
jgi:AAA domain